MGTDWQEAAYDRLRIFLILIAGAPFLSETFVLHAEAHGLAPPKDARAYGAIIRRAARRGQIVKVGYAPAASSNLSPKCLWRGV
jgi:hypothetical protein